MDKSMETGLFPGPVALLLTIIENEVLPGKLMDAIPGDEDTPVIPTHLLNYGSSEAVEK